ncbi:N-acetylmuramoyl-L-alanine amidase family protein [Adlercreutzia muris]|uniref:N-acetylmuramoyl-L-alanine amidase family protein n=1 Tax=Adlercreutzia muris TaxID=1796610 RepID=A0A7C8BTH9_9ACTN|nr:N-acetylmuramoyl-L-alanine amidase family protein [Adlercreutzia muris]KAB1636619.1 N-acetylmuramoyl-L-alanine amidase family protein [Adlercreutzia muris]
MEAIKRSVLGRVTFALALVAALGIGTTAYTALDTQVAYAAQPGWQQVGEKWKYIDESGQPVKNEEKLISKKWYQFDNEGWMVTGWWLGEQTIDTSGTREKCWKYYNAAGDRAKGWKKLNGKWYFFDVWANCEGAMFHSGWHYVGVGYSPSYFAYFDNSGVWVTNRWVRDRLSDELWNYLDESGQPVSGWKKLDGNWYRFRSEGDEGGAQPGKTALVGWWKVNNTWYYFKDSCAMATGWQKIGGSWYYLGSPNDGAMKTGWQKISGAWYYLGGSSDGAMKTGWQKIGNSWYYLYSSGAMAANTWVGNYHVNGSGAWDKSR